MYAEGTIFKIYLTKGLCREKCLPMFYPVSAIFFLMNIEKES